MKNPYKKYLLFCISIIFTVSLCSILFNRIVDPYGFFAGPRVANFNANKIYIPRERAVLSAKPDVLILGSSRAYLGLNPKDDAWHGKKVFNIAAGGDNIFDSFHKLKHTNDNTEIREAYLMIDFFMFNTSRKPYIKKEYEYLSSILSDENIMKKNIISSLFSLSTSIDSFRTIKNQQSYSEDFMNFGLPFYDAVFPTHSKFLSTERAFYKVHYRNYSMSTFDENSLDGFRNILSYARENNISLIIGISPMHTRMLEVIDISNLWNEFEEWKKSIANIIKLEAGETRNQFRLYDFATYNKYTSEKNPQEQKHINIKWFLDPSHYSRNLGSKIIDRMLGTQEIDSEFGVEIQFSGIEEHLMNVRKERKLWRGNHPIDFNEIQTMKH